MRIAVVALSEKKSEQLTKIAHAVGREFSAMGQHCDVMTAGGSGLSGYDFLVFCSDSASVATVKNNRLSQLLASSGMLVGKRSMALLVAKGFFRNKKLGRYMSLLEKEGLILTMAELISNEAEAVAAARGAPLVRG
ncbi:MAG: hypothetical protein RBT72_02730 [Spirochaetia bacterium]|jgi:hypothetical protein|nr:hypothetical protein [Spirochaetales bacterium]MDX9783647.1 hypothetical protein [Spirochaetia bacterium]